MLDLSEAQPFVPTSSEKGIAKLEDLVVLGNVGNDKRKRKAVSRFAADSDIRLGKALQYAGLHTCVAVRFRELLCTPAAFLAKSGGLHR